MIGVDETVTIGVGVMVGVGCSFTPHPKEELTAIAPTSNDVAIIFLIPFLGIIIVTNTVKI
jgi:hypothetical protein